MLIRRQDHVIGDAFHQPPRRFALAHSLEGESYFVVQERRRELPPEIPLGMIKISHLRIIIIFVISISINISIIVLIIVLKTMVEWI